ncbi:MAG: ribose 5-phosphate isomerase A [Flavobacteriaceae bacterium]|jgi:ribose 5-phosphate isomerase A|nr:ribose 5-phosphate isomerase A [Flavobacteriaceae bacterium]|tara:strand:- start:4902 stop:5570 length:669 start_codon:yes stop_codon:yes gene_type:complete
MTPKELVASYTYDLVKKDFHKDFILGIGTGSTANCFIEKIIENKPEIRAFVSSSEMSTNLLKSAGYEVSELNDVGGPDLYIDGADEINEKFELIKGGGGAHTREKIVAAASRKFICIIDDSKIVRKLGKFSIAIEVIPMSRSFVARQIVAMGGKPTYRIGFETDNGNQIIDVLNLNLDVPYETEKRLNRIPGVVDNGIFSIRKADIAISANSKEARSLKQSL